MNKYVSGGLQPPEIQYYTQKLIVVKFFSVLYIFFGLKNLGLTLEFRSLVGIGRSGVMIGRLPLDMGS